MYYQVKYCKICVLNLLKINICLSIKRRKNIKTYTLKVRMWEKAWIVSVRYMWDLPHNSHGCFIEPLREIHVWSMLYSRYVPFLQTAQKLTFLTLLQIVKKYLQTVTSRNICPILAEIEPEAIFKVKKSDGNYNSWRKL